MLKTLAIIIVMLISISRVNAEDTLRLTSLDLNGDCVSDTICSVGSICGVMQLAYIDWGMRTSTNSCDSLWCADTTKIFFSRTILRYPNLTSVQSSLLSFFFNYDQKKDLIVYVRGSYATSDTVTDSLALYRDTTFVLALLTQRGLDTIDTLDMPLDSGLITGAATMRYVRIGDGIEELGNSIRGNCSVQRILKQSITTDLVDTTSMPRLAAGSLGQNPTVRHQALLRLEVYPNPSDGARITVSYSGLAGRGRLLVTSLQGATLMNVGLDPLVNSRSESLEIDLTNEAQGLYALSLLDDIGRSSHTTVLIIR